MVQENSLEWNILSQLVSAILGRNRPAFCGQDGDQAGRVVEGSLLVSLFSASILCIRTT